MRGDCTSSGPRFVRFSTGEGDRNDPARKMSEARRVGRASEELGRDDIRKPYLSIVEGSQAKMRPLRSTTSSLKFTLVIEGHAAFRRTGVNQNPLLRKRRTL